MNRSIAPVSPWTVLPNLGYKFCLDTKNENDNAELCHALHKNKKCDLKRLKSYEFLDYTAMNIRILSAQILGKLRNSQTKYSQVKRQYI